MRDILIAVTVDYETWHPTVDGYEKRWQENNIIIDWKKDVIDSTYALLDIADEVGVKLTLMAEMCEYMWLKENEPCIAKKIAEQIQNTIIRGHDVQLHIHPHWMPETGARKVGGVWKWNCEYAKAENYPYDLNEMIQRCKNELEAIIIPVKEDYKVTCFRAGSYLVQPFTRLYNALVENNIMCDTSVYKGGMSSDRGYDFSRCNYRNQPYLADKADPSNENKLNSCMVELPIYAWKDNKRWKFDNGELFANEFILKSKNVCCETENYFVMIGHSKERQDYEKMKKQFVLMQKTFIIEWVTLSELENRAKKYVKCGENKQIKKMPCSAGVLFKAQIGIWIDKVVDIYKRRIQKI